jgi:hypothetical protein
MHIRLRSYGRAAADVRCSAGQGLLTMFNFFSIPWNRGNVCASMCAERTLCTSPRPWRTELRSSIGARRAPRAYLR